MFKKWQKINHCIVSEILLNKYFERKEIAFVIPISGTLPVIKRFLNIKKKIKTHQILFSEYMVIF